MLLGVTATDKPGSVAKLLCATERVVTVLSESQFKLFKAEPLPKENEPSPSDNNTCPAVPLPETLSLVALITLSSIVQVAPSEDLISPLSPSRFTVVRSVRPCAVTRSSIRSPIAKALAVVLS